MFVVTIMLFAFGLVIGSFLNVLIYRLPRGLNIAKGRSFCPKCKKKISWYDNIPLLSFILLRRKCRRCGKHISWRYPAVELLTAVVFVLVGLREIGEIGGIREIWGFVLSLTLVCTLIVVFFTDLETMIIPDEILVPAIIVFFVYKIGSAFPIPNIPASQGEQYLIPILFPALLSFLFLFLVYLITKRQGIGFGDVKFALLMGLSLGYPKIIVAFYIAFLTGALIGIILILFGKAKWKKKIAFGPFLCLGTFVSFVWGEQIARWAIQLLV